MNIYNITDLNSSCLSDLLKFKEEILPNYLDNIRRHRNIRIYSSTSLVRSFWDEILWHTTEEPRTKEGKRKVDIGAKF